VEMTPPTPNWHWQILVLVIIAVVVLKLLKVIARIACPNREVLNTPMRFHRHEERCREKFSTERGRSALRVAFLLAAVFAVLFWLKHPKLHIGWVTPPFHARVHSGADQNWIATKTAIGNGIPGGDNRPGAVVPPNAVAPPAPAAPPTSAAPPAPHVLPPAPKRSTALAAVTGALAETFRKAGRTRTFVGEAALAEARKKISGPSDSLEQPKQDRPDWVGAPERKIDDTIQVCVSTVPYLSPQECEPELAEQIQVKVAEFIERQLRDEDPKAVSRVQLPPEFVHDHIVRAIYQEAVENPLTTTIVKLRDDVSSPKMVRKHALLVFDRETRSEIDKQWNDVVTVRRLETAGFGLASVLLVVGIAWGYLKADLATSGAYRGRLRALAVLAILAIVAAIVPMVR